MDENLVKEYAQYLAQRDYKPRGIEEKLRDARQFLLYAEEQALDPYHIGLKEAESFRERLSLMVSDKGNPLYHPETINCRLSNLKNFYGFLVGRRLAFKNPFFDAERLKEGYRIPKNILSIKQIEKLLKGLEVQTREDFIFKLLIELLYATGSRISEIEKLNRADVDLDSGYILIRDDKERQDRKAPLTEYALKLLKLYVKLLYKEGSPCLFPHGKERSLNRWINDRLKRVTRGLGIPVITCHGIRHTVATHLFKSGADIREVQEFLGHRRIKSTEVYTRVLTEDLQKALRKNHPREIRGRDDEA